MDDQITNLEALLDSTESEIEALADYLSYEPDDTGCFGEYYLTLLVQPKEVKQVYSLKLGIFFDKVNLVPDSSMNWINHNREDNDLLYSDFTELSDLCFSFLQDLARLLWLDDLRQVES